MFLPLTLSLLLAPQNQEPASHSSKEEVVTEAAIQAVAAKVKEILPRVAELRGREFKKGVPSGVKTPDQFMEFAKATMDEEYGEGKFEAWTKAYRLFGFIGEEDDLESLFAELLRGQVGGWYDPAEARFWMVSTYNKGGMADIIMAHELTHALDDQYYDLAGMLEDAIEMDSDAQFGLRAVVEGSGTSLMNLYTIKGMMSGWLKLDPAAMQEMMAEQAESLETAPPFLVMSLTLPYVVGNRFLLRTTDAMVAAMTPPTLDDLDQAFANPPVSSEQVLHPEKYWDPKKIDLPKPVAIPDLSANLGEGWELLDEDVMGELGAYVLCEEELPDMLSMEGQMSSMTSKAASGWGGDLYQVYGGPGDATLLCWASVWDSKKDRDEFLLAVEDVVQHHCPRLESWEAVGTEGALLIFADKAGKDTAPILREACRLTALKP
jgi:hypothetical protein